LQKKITLCLYLFSRALSQLFAISPEATEYPYMTESFLAYYDTFVRHSMGNFRDILKEVGKKLVFSLFIA
jgi:hypothetical protein